MSRVAVFNPQYQFINFTSWRSAINLVLLEKAVLLEEMPVVKEVSTVSKRFVITAAIKLLHTVKPRYRTKPKQWSKPGVLKRDNWICCYCGIGDGEYNKYGELLHKNDFTVDHVLPKSKGGKDTWKNTVCSCRDCNTFKADRTPAQAGMKMLWKPHRPKATEQTDMYIQLITGSL